MRTVSSKVDNGFHEKVVKRCDGLGCSPSQYIKDLIEQDLNAGDVAKPTPQGRIVEVDSGRATAKSEPYDVWHPTDGCCSRYKANGELMFHFKPIEKENGIQYYRDTENPNPKIKWSYRKERGWTPRVSLY